METPSRRDFFRLGLATAMAAAATPPLTALAKWHERTPGASEGDDPYTVSLCSWDLPTAGVLNAKHYFLRFTLPAMDIAFEIHGLATNRVTKKPAPIGLPVTDDILVWSRYETSGNGLGEYLHGVPHKVEAVLEKGSDPSVFFKKLYVALAASDLVNDLAIPYVPISLGPGQATTNSNTVARTLLEAAGYALPAHIEGFAPGIENNILKDNRKWPDVMALRETLSESGSSLAELSQRAGRQFFSLKTSPSAGKLLVEKDDRCSLDNSCVDLLRELSLIGGALDSILQDGLPLCRDIGMYYMRLEQLKGEGNKGRYVGDRMRFAEEAYFRLRNEGYTNLRPPPWLSQSPLLNLS